MMENLTISETRIEPKRLKLVGIKNLWIMDFWKIFTQTNQKRPEAKVDLGGHMTTLSKWYQIKSMGHPKYLKVYPREKIQKESFN